VIGQSVGAAAGLAMDIALEMPQETSCRCPSIRHPRPRHRLSAAHPARFTSIACRDDRAVCLIMVGSAGPRRYRWGQAQHLPRASRAPHNSIISHPGSARCPPPAPTPSSSSRHRRPRLRQDFPAARRARGATANSTCRSSASRRSPMSIEEFRTRARSSLEAKGASTKNAWQALWSKAALPLRRLPTTPTPSSACARNSATPRNPLHYLAIPPSMFEDGPARARAVRSAATVQRHTSRNTFGRDLESAQELNRTLHAHFPSRRCSASTTTSARRPCRTCSISASPIPSSSRCEPARNIASVQITMAEAFGVKNRGRLLRQRRRDSRCRAEPPAAVVSLLAMDAPIGQRRPVDAL